MRRLGVSALLILAGSAEAQVRKVAVVVVAPEPGLEGAALMSGRTARGRLAKDPRFELVDLEARARGAVDMEKAARAKSARDSFARGVNALDAVEYAQAVEQLGGAVKAYLDTDLTANFPALLDAIGMSAVALRQSGDSNAADDELTRLFTLSPEYRFAPGRWPPAVQGWLDRKQTAIRALTPAGVEVASPAAPAEVFVDGTYRGVTPLEVKELLPGRHVLTLSAPGYATKNFEVSAGPGQAASPSLEVAPLGRELLSRLENLKAGCSRGSPEAAGRGLLAWAGAPELVVVALEAKDGGVWATATRVTAQGRAAQKRKSLGSAGAPALEEVGGLALALLEQPESSPGLELESKPVASGGGRRTAGLVVGGVGLAAGVGGIILGVHAQAKAKEARLTPQVDEAAYGEAVAAARTAGAVADVLYITAAVGLGVGLVLVLTGGSSAEPPREVAVSAAAAPGGGWVSIGGAF